MLIIINRHCLLVVDKCKKRILPSELSIWKKEQSFDMTKEQLLAIKRIVGISRFKIKRVKCNEMFSNQFPWLSHELLTKVRQLNDWSNFRSRLKKPCAYFVLLHFLFYSNLLLILIAQHFDKQFDFWVYLAVMCNIYAMHDNAYHGQNTHNMHACGYCVESFNITCHGL